MLEHCGMKLTSLLCRIEAPVKEQFMSHDRISADPAIMMGKPCIKGTRITVELILRKLGAGRSFADLLEAYPRLTEEDMRAALAFAADYMQHETVLKAG
jgi:uncharacterized protein (DUF433 family)